MERVGAVVRLKTIEKEWEAKGTPLAKPYAKAVLAMLPTTPYVPSRPPVHESINDVTVHPATRQQIFYPTSESRAFNRVDAGKAFDSALLPTDSRVPHPELIKLEKMRLDGYNDTERQRLAAEMFAAEREETLKRERMRRDKEARETKVVKGKRGWDFKFQDISVERVGKDGRSEKGVGWRYGMPHEDRKPGQIKVPRSAW
ncbi:hypothetical protein LTS18_000279 [Coniosporium uncinatum]|uniref:Uncharacterized protein n=1 Tax=Coniosporium uncinatum TaxID=93489 RepID=A0ACC3DG44_9PEZI|nr:hypothetical protein LTS18_000279 [Coniosporium uncinatum]